MARHGIRFAAVLLFWLPAWAGTVAQNVEEVVVYTNADVEKLEPIPTGSPAAHAVFDPEAWAFVSAFLEREREKIRADRDHDLERERVRIEADRPVGYGERYPVFLRAPYWPRLPVVHVDVEDDGDADGDDGDAPHPMFRERPPVREFVPGLGDAYRGNAPRRGPAGKDRR